MSLTNTCTEPVPPLEIRGTLLARNTLLNFFGAMAPLVIGVMSIPYVIRGLGVDRFGILSLAWVSAGYLGFLNLGLGPATTKFISELLAKGETHRLPVLVWTSVWLSVILGIVGGVALATAAPFLIERVFKLPPGLAVEAFAVFILIACSFPAVFATGALRGVLEASQRFDLINAVNLPLSSANFLIPAMAVWRGFSLPAIVGFLLLSKVAALLAYLVLGLRLYPSLRRPPILDRGIVWPLLSFGGWVSVGEATGPIITYLDRFLIGALISMTAVGYYAAPYEAIMRAGVIAGALVGVIFPAFSALYGSQNHTKVGDLFVRSMRYLLLSMGPFAILLIFFARDILGIWLGNEFVRQSTRSFQVLAVGMLLSSLFWVPHVLLQAVGRPDVPAKILLVTLPLYASLAWIPISRFGITGAALAWTLRVAIQGAALVGACVWLRLAFSRRFGETQILRSLGLFGGLCAALAGISFLQLTTLAARIVVSFPILVFFSLAVWHLGLRPDERQGLRRGVRRIPILVHIHSFQDAE